MVVLERVCIMRWDSELEEGVFTIIWCSGVVTGPNMLTTDQYILSLTQLKKLGLISYHIMWAIYKLFFKMKWNILSMMFIWEKLLFLVIICQ